MPWWYYLTTQTSYFVKAPEIDGYIKPEQDSVTITTVKGTNVYYHTFVYTKEKEEVIPTGTVQITYVGVSSGDVEWRWLIGSDYYSDVTGTQTYYAPEIDGYIKPEQDSVTFTIEEGTNEYYHTFMYTEEKAVPIGIIEIRYQDERGNTLRSTDIYRGVTGTQTYYAPEIDGYIKPEQDSVTFTIEEGTNEYYHIFIYDKEQEIPEGSEAKAAVYITYAGIGDIEYGRNYLGFDDRYYKISIDDYYYFLSHISLDYYKTYDGRLYKISIGGDGYYYFLISFDYYEYYESVGDQTFYAPEIEGYIKPEKDSVTFTIEEGTNEYYHTFIYEYDKEKAVPIQLQLLEQLRINHIILLL